MKKLQKRNNLMIDTVEAYTCMCGCYCGCSPSWVSDGSVDTRYWNKVDYLEHEV